MRIRKNRKLSHEIVFGSSVDENQLQPHFCQLNQSPWDAIPFSQESVHQLERRIPFNEYDTSQNSIPAADRIEKEEGPKMRKRLDKVSEEEEAVTDKQASPMCDDDMDNPKSCSSKSNKADSSTCIVLGLVNPRIKKNNQRVVGGACRGETARAGKRERALNTSNGQEFYYYSGFGPLWGKKKR